MPQVQVNGINYYFEERGQGTPLLMLHGFTGSSVGWRELGEMLAGHCRIIAIDLPGHGHSSSPNNPQRYAMEDVASDIITLLQTIEIQHSDLLGYSMGGRLALYLAINKPDFFGSLILESASPGLDSQILRQNRINQDNLLADFIETEGIPAFITQWQQLPLFESQQKLPRARQEEQRQQRLKNSPVGLANSLRGMGTGCQPSLWQQLATLRLPTLLLSGAFDPKYVAIGRRMAQIITDSELKIMPNAGHNIHLETPDQFASTILAFLISRNQLAHAKEEHKEERY